MTRKRPNTIIFNPNQIRKDALHHLGNPAAVTPFLDSFTQTKAVSFRNAFYQNPVCASSRCSFVSGLYPHVRGHRTMGHLLHTQETFLLKELKEDGYYVRFNAHNDLATERIPGQIASHVAKLYYDSSAESAPGPVHEHIHGGHGDKNFYSFYTGELKLGEHGRNYNGDGEDLNTTVEHILHPVDERPPCLFLGTTYPHPPYQIGEPYFSAIDHTLLPNRIRAEDTRGKVLISELVRIYQNMQTYTKDNWKELRAMYLGMCMKIDSQFRCLCKALKLTGIYDNSAIFFFSDHGDYTGDYGLTEKTQNTFEDCLTNVPFLVEPPKGYELDCGVTDSLIELVGFCATALDFAGTSPAHDHFGKSLAPVIANQQKQIRSFVCCEGGRCTSKIQCRGGVDPDNEGRSRDIIYWPHYTAQWNDDAHTEGTTIRNDKCKCVYRSSDAGELYDLELSPGKTINLVDKPEYQTVTRQMIASFLSQYQDTCGIVPHTTDERFGRQMVQEEAKRLCPAGHEEEVRSKVRRGMGLFLAQEYCRRLRKQQETSSVKNR